jgi:hypothetical protein
MEYRLATLHTLTERSWIGQVANNEIRAQPVKVLAPAPGSHQEAQFCALLCQQACYVAPDEPGRSGYKGLHNPSLRKRKRSRFRLRSRTLMNGSLAL